ncbi:MAG TPA: SIS domain-containing protein [Streptosporangiaceae bacterium]|nr:SIS domain-containing protein [Streptosporangiaceae bacterium]
MTREVAEGKGVTMADEAKTTGGIAIEAARDDQDSTGGQFGPGNGVGPRGQVGPADTVQAAFERRVAPARDLVDHAAEITEAAQAMAIRFDQGGKLIVFGIGSACTDAQHVAVEFVHPVIVGKRALPAISLTSDVATLTAIAARSGLSEVFAYQLKHLAQPNDIALGISVDGECPSVLAGLRTARDAGLLTIALAGRGGGTIAAKEAAKHLLTVQAADRRVIKEIQVTTYHLLWELVHVFLEQPSVLSQGTVTP